MTGAQPSAEIVKRSDMAVNDCGINVLIIRADQSSTHLSLDGRGHSVVVICRVWCETQNLIWSLQQLHQRWCLVCSFELLLIRQRKPTEQLLQ